MMVMRVPATGRNKTACMAVGLACLAMFSTANSLPGYKIFHVGNSLTDETYGVNDAAVSLGHTGVEWGRYMIPGSPIHLLWTESSNAGAGFLDALRPVTAQWGERPPAGARAYLQSAPVDVLVMQIFNSNGDSYVNQWAQPNLNSATIDGIVGFARTVYASNPDCQIYLYASHTMTVGATDNSMTSTIINYKALKDTIEHAFPNQKKVWIIPAPLAFNKMVADGSGDIWSGDGHTNANGAFLLSMLFYSCIYKSDCAGATHSSTALSATLGSVSAAFAAKAQSVAWEIARTYEYSGVSGTEVADLRVTGADRNVTHNSKSQRIFDLQGKSVARSGVEGTAIGWYVNGDRIVQRSSLLR